MCSCAAPGDICSLYKSGFGPPVSLAWLVFGAVALPINHFSTACVLACRHRRTVLGSCLLHTLGPLMPPSPVTTPLSTVSQQFQCNVNSSANSDMSCSKNRGFHRPKMAKLCHPTVGCAHKTNKMKSVAIHVRNVQLEALSTHKSHWSRFAKCENQCMVKIMQRGTHF